MTDRSPVHLGDGAYASPDGDGIVVTANHHDPRLATDVVYLDAQAVAALLRWLAPRSPTGECGDPQP